MARAEVLPEAAHVGKVHGTLDALELLLVAVQANLAAVGDTLDVLVGMRLRTGGRFRSAAAGAALVDDADVTVQRAPGAGLVGAEVALVRLLLHVDRDDVLLHVDLEMGIILGIDYRVEHDI